MQFLPISILISEVKNKRLFIYIVQYTKSRYYSFSLICWTFAVFVVICFAMQPKTVTCDCVLVLMSKIFCSVTSV